MIQLYTEAISNTTYWLVMPGDSSDIVKKLGFLSQLAPARSDQNLVPS
jgi:hypothetical protein